MFSAVIPAEAGLMDNAKRFDRGKASVHVASYANTLPSLNWETVIPSSRRPSLQYRLTDAKTVAF